MHLFIVIFKSFCECLFQGLSSRQIIFSYFNNKLNELYDLIFLESFTCAFTLQLPAYSTKEIMYERLNYAITYCPGIDADGDMN